MSVFITPDGVQLYYQVSGSGKPLLFLHGWTMCSRVWRYQVEWFARNYQVTTLDLRGHGRSESPHGEYSVKILAQDITHFIEGVPLKEVTLIGWSLAVSLILELCDSHLSDTDSLVLIGGTPVFAANNTFPHGLPYPKIKRMLKLVESDFAQALEAFHDLLLTEEEEKIENRDEIWDLLTNERYLPRQEVARDLLVSLYSEDLRRKIDAVTVPTLLMHGGQDTICLPEAARYMKERLPHGELTIFPEAGHAPFLTQADAFNQKLGDFLASL